jgi:Tol biopolymer transport system component
MLAKRHDVSQSVSFTRRSVRSIAITALFLAGIAPPLVHDASAQYFGRNQVRYRTFKYQVLKTEHFDIYYYPEEEKAIREAARMAERWYTRLSTVLDHQLSGRQPLVLYASHPDFEQTNTLMGELGEGTGGVTEVLKRRIVLPLAGPLADTDHVIGHELVHAFQFDITRPGGGVSFTSSTAIRMPLWFIEGMAEYLSIGPVDPSTAMWMRDAAIVNKIPTIHRLSDPRFFPYRYGQALWAYIAGRWGDPVVGEILKATLKTPDAERAIQQIIGVSADTLSADWHAALRSWSAPTVAASEPIRSSARVIAQARHDIGRLNVGPALSPDGTRVVYLSERDLFSIEMYLADAKTGRVIRKITRTAVDPHFQSLQFIASAGSFSPDGKRFAFATVQNGRPVLTVINPSNGAIKQEVPLPDLGEIFSPSWSPDQRRIVISGLAGGLTDLYIVDLETRAVRRLTDDAYADLEPAWSPDGRSIAFVTDRFVTSLERLEYGDMQLARIDPESGEVTALPTLGSGKHIDPQWTRDGKGLYLISDYGGISNIYRLDLESSEFTRVTRVATGVSGITRTSPALSSARNVDAIAFSVYEAGNYDLFLIDNPARLAGRPVASVADSSTAATLPPIDRSDPEETHPMTGPARGGSVRLAPDSTFSRSKYRPRLGLDYIGATTLGAAAGSNGVAVGGGTTLYWSDMLGNHNLATQFQVVNAGGSFVNNVTAAIDYENRRSRWNWGFSVGQIPYVSVDILTDESDSLGLIRQRTIRSWQIDRVAQLNTAYPFSRVQRIELSGGFRRLDFVDEVETQYFDAFTGRELVDSTGAPPGGNSPALNLYTGSAAYVYDNSIFGGTSPVLGQSVRLQASPVVGDLEYAGVLADIRRYVMFARPFTLAGRLMHFGRYGRDSENPRLSPIFIGDSWLIHGYDSGSFRTDEGVFDQLFGSRIAIANVELRVPLLGALGLIQSPGVPPVEAATFYDVGTAWTSFDKPTFMGGRSRAMSSYGAALRANLLGFAVGEIAVVHPNERPTKGWYWQFSLQPGF